VISSLLVIPPWVGVDVAVLQALENDLRGEMKMAIYIYRAISRVDPSS